MRQEAGIGSKGANDTSALTCVDRRSFRSGSCSALKNGDVVKVERGYPCGSSIGTPSGEKDDACLFVFVGIRSGSSGSVGSGRRGDGDLLLVVDKTMSPMDEGERRGIAAMDSQEVVG